MKKFYLPSQNNTFSASDSSFSPHSGYNSPHPDADTAYRVEPQSTPNLFNYTTDSAPSYSSSGKDNQSFNASADNTHYDLSVEQALQEYYEYMNSHSQLRR